MRCSPALPHEARGQDARGQLILRCCMVLPVLFCLMMTDERLRRLPVWPGCPARMPCSQLPRGAVGRNARTEGRCNHPHPDACIRVSVSEHLSLNTWCLNTCARTPAPGTRHPAPRIPEHARPHAPLLTRPPTPSGAVPAGRFRPSGHARLWACGAARRRSDP